jgi:hypothetical protein
MANRLATSGDVTTYGNGMQVNDIIIDTPTATAGGTLEYANTTLGTTFSGARTGFTLWIKGDVGEWHRFYIGNGGSVISQSNTEVTPCYIKPLPGTRVVFRQTANSNTGYLMSVNDFKHLVVDWESDLYPGMRDGLGVNVFQTNSHGCKFYAGDGTNFYSGGANQFVLFGVDQGTYHVKGGEYSHGFAAIRLHAANANITWKRLTIQRPYIHDTCTGEGYYIGMTSGTPVPKFATFLLEDFLIVRTATEAVQLQHFMRGDNRGYVRNFMVFASGADWLNPFGANQDNGIQYLPAEGDTYMMNFIVDGFGDNGIIINGSDQGTQKTQPVVVANGLINDGRNTGLYFNANTTNGLTHEWRKLYFRGFNNTYGESGTARDFVISQNNGNEIHKFISCQWDGSKGSLFQASGGYEIQGFTNGAMNAPVYVNSGFYEAAEKFEHWKATYTAGGAVAYKTGDIVANIENGVEYAFYKSKTNHNATATRPSADTTNWQRLTWDESGTRSDQLGWSSGDTQSIYPPDDFRLVSDNVWNKKGLGLLSNEPNTDYTLYQWQRQVGSEWRNIPSGKNKKYTPTSDDRNRLVRCGVREKTASGYRPWKYSSPKLVS